MKHLAVVLALGGLAMSGCGEPPAPTPSTAGPAEAAEGHTHGDGPHGGVIADWGGGAYHVEFTVDHDKEEATVYILASDAQTASPIEAEKITLSIEDPAFQVDLTAQPLDGEPVGQSSRFVGQHDNLGAVREFSGSITGELEGTPYAADFAE